MSSGTPHKLDWKKLIQEQSESELSMRGYCTLHDIPYHAFLNHKNELGANGRKKAVEPLFKEVRCEKSEEYLCFKIDGHRLEFERTTSDEDMARIMKVMVTI